MDHDDRARELDRQVRGAFSPETERERAQEREARGRPIGVGDFLLGGFLLLAFGIPLLARFTGWLETTDGLLFAGMIVVVGVSLYFLLRTSNKKS